MNDNIVYDTHFNGNEIFVICLIVLGFGSIWLLPRPFSPLQVLFNLLIAITFGLMFDHTIAIPPFDLYDFGDEAKYQLFDIFSYAMYSPYGYWFIYWHKRLRISGGWTIAYILFWTALAILLEWAGVYVGLFHYKNGYRLLYSFPIYLILQSIHLGLYQLTFNHNRWKKSNAR